MKRVAKMWILSGGKLTVSIQREGQETIRRYPGKASLERLEKLIKHLPEPYMWLGEHGPNFFWDFDLDE